MLKAKGLQLLKYITILQTATMNRSAQGKKKTKNKTTLSIAKRLFSEKENKAIC